MAPNPHPTPVSNLSNKDGKEYDIHKRRINGGLDAWLGVLAGFCVFVNSWLVNLYFELEC
jgi:hypothetical protein